MSADLAVEYQYRAWLRQQEASELLEESVMAETEWLQNNASVSELLAIANPAERVHIEDALSRLAWKRAEEEIQQQVADAKREMIRA